MQIFRCWFKFWNNSSVYTSWKFLNYKFPEDELLAVIFKWLWNIFCVCWRYRVVNDIFYHKVQNLSMILVTSSPCVNLVRFQRRSSSKQNLYHAGRTFLSHKTVSTLVQDERTSIVCWGSEIRKAEERVKEIEKVNYVRTTHHIAKTSRKLFLT